MRAAHPARWAFFSHPAACRLRRATGGQRSPGSLWNYPAIHVQRTQIREAMEDRSTAICIRDRRILLVAREHSSRVTRWSLPGGKRTVSETPAEACRRELVEEPSISPLSLDYLFSVRRARQTALCFSRRIGAGCASPRQQ
ncbi:NUDIX domain-containing protein [Paraburkholderia sp. BL18I3N2]|uniref:NUDIX domain-containing protein n=1 Tax=Paraburkholderia sp. BL18I3N2 TaxID=1938799 RepID=UPI00280C1796|nr:NUDIX domain-containing protein [Paraburkholderia sp. BL18I3N2]